MKIIPFGRPYSPLLSFSFPELLFARNTEVSCFPGVVPIWPPFVSVCLCGFETRTSEGNLGLVLPSSAHFCHCSHFPIYFSVSIACQVPIAGHNSKYEFPHRHCHPKCVIVCTFVVAVILVQRSWTLDSTIFLLSPQLVWISPPLFCAGCAADFFTPFPFSSSLSLLSSFQLFSSVSAVRPFTLVTSAQPGPVLWVQRTVLKALSVEEPQTTASMLTSAPQNIQH